jgi:hypothetical protein
MTSPILRVRGHNGQITLWPTKVEIARQGGLAVLTQGLKGSKDIPLRSIVAVQLKRCDMMTNGYLQITIAGGNESRGGLFAATKDENTVMFTRQQQAAFVDLKDRLDAMIERTHAPSGQVAASSLSAVEQLEKLAGLRAAGVLSDDEFAQQKAAILGNVAPAQPAANDDLTNAPPAAPLLPVDAERSPSSRGVALVLCLLFGVVGVHRLYTGHVGIALAQLLTLGGCGVWVVVDLMLLLTGTYTDSKGRTL